jgi:hypothetical protein
MPQVGIRQFQLEEGSRRTKDRIFIVELIDRAMNRTFLLCVKIESKSSAFGQKWNLGGRERIFFVCYLSPIGRVVELRPIPTWSLIVFRC